jgi:hypothetical protein
MEPGSLAALDKIIAVANSVSEFYGAQEAGGAAVAKSFKGKLHEYQKKVRHRAVCAVVRCCCDCCRCHAAGLRVDVR